MTVTCNIFYRLVVSLNLDLEISLSGFFFSLCFLFFCGGEGLRLEVEGLVIYICSYNFFFFFFWL